MNDCITWGGFFEIGFTWVTEVFQWGCRWWHFFMADASKHPVAKTMDRETANQQAAQMLDAYGNNILRLAYSYLHNMSDAEEILQDTLIQFLKTMPIFENENHKKAWLLRVAANLSKNRIEYNHIRKSDELDKTLAAEQQEDLSFVWEAVKALPSQFREAIHLFYYEGYSTAQIAELLQMKESTVRSNLHRGRAKLKEVLKEAYDFEDTV